MASDLCATGIPGLDAIMRGGFPRGHFYLIAGDPGVGKTTLGINFLLAGAAAGERCVYVTLSETKGELEKVAASHGWSLDRITVIDLSALEAHVAPAAQGTIFLSSEVELNETSKSMLAMIDAVNPARLVIDSVSEMRLLARDPLRYRRQVLLLKQHFVKSGCTTLILDDATHQSGMDVSTVAHGVIGMTRIKTEYGVERRRLSVEKMRGVTYLGGFHDYTIVHGGLSVFPRLVAANGETAFESGQLTSGIGNLDALIGGGLDRGSATLIVGAAGTGKSTIANQFVASAAVQGKKVAIFSFDETTRNLIERAAGLGIDLAAHVKSGAVVIRQIDPAELTPGELAFAIKGAVEEDGVEVVVIDSLNGYLQAMTQEQFLVLHLHELLMYLNQRGVITLMVLAQHGLLGQVDTPADITYLADAVIVIRYFEAVGRVKKAISMIKKRTGRHENAIRELSTEGGALRVGLPITDFHGVLTGMPTFAGAARQMLTHAPKPQ